MSRLNLKSNGYIDRTVSEKMDITNKVTKIAIDRINKKSKPAGRDEILTTLSESIIDGDDYIRYRLTRRFDGLAQSLYEAHKKETQAEAVGSGFLKMFNKQLSKYEDTKAETGSTEEAKLAVFADQMGVDLKKAPEDEKQTLLNIFKRSKFAQFFKKRK